MATVLPINLIVSDPKVRNGRPIIADTGVRVQDIVAYYLFDQQTPQALAEGFGLSLAQVHAALAYYFLHQDEIEASMRADDAKAEALFAELAAQGKAMRLMRTAHC